MNNTILGKIKISNKIKLEIYDEIMLFIILYEMESLAFQDEYRNKIIALEKRCMKRIVGKIMYRVRNKESKTRYLRR